MVDTHLSWHFHRLFLWSEADFCLSQFKMQSLFFQHLWVKTRKQNYQVRKKGTSPQQFQTIDTVTIFLFSIIK